MICSDLLQKSRCLPLLFLIVLAACAKAPELTTQDGTTATFVAQEITGRQVSLSAKDSLQLSRTARIHFVACMKDVGHAQPLIGQVFVIEGGESPQRTVTNTEGCLHWEEAMDFNFAAPETFLNLSRSFQAQRPHRGTQVVQLAVNPWNSDGAAVLDLRYSSPLKLASLENRATALTGPEARTEIVTDGFSISVPDESVRGGQASLILQLTTHPRFTRVDINGRTVNEPFKSGRFRISAALLEKVGATRAILSRTEAVAEVRNETLVLQSELQLSRAPRQDATLELAYRLEALDAPYPLTPEEGGLSLAGLKSRSSVTRQSLPVPFAAYTETQVSDEGSPVSARGTAPSNSAPAGACTDGSDGLAFFFDRRTIQHAGVTAVTPRENVPSEIAIQLGLCLRNPLDGRPIAGHPFEVSLTGAKGAGSAPVSRTTDSDGCLVWTEKMRFDYFQPEQWFSRTIQVTSRQAPIENVTKSLPIQINPWQTGEAFYWDCRKGAAPRPAIAKPARLDVTDFSYSFLGQDFEVDRYLNMTFKRKYQIRMQPVILRQSAVSQNLTPESLGDGRYRLRALLLSQNMEGAAASASIYSSYKYLSSFETEVQARNGVLLSEVTLPVEFPELPLLADRNLLVVEISPSGSSSLKPVTVSAPFLALSESGGSGMVNSRDGYAEMAEKFNVAAFDTSEASKTGRNAKALRDSTKEPATALFRRTLGLRELSPADIQRSGLSESDLLSLVANPQGSPAASKKFCDLLYPDAGKALRCRTKPGDALRITVTRHAEKILSRPTQMDTKISMLSVNANIQRDSSLTDSSSKGSTSYTDAHAGTSAKLGGSIGILSADVNAGLSKGKTWFTTRQVSTSTGRVESSTLSLGKYFAVEELEFSFEAQTRTCVAVETTTPSVPGYHACPQSTSKRERAFETWYFATQSFLGDSTPLRDSRASGNRPWVKVLRGKSAYLRFKNLLENKTNSIVIERDRLFEDFNAKLTDPAQRFVNNYPTLGDGNVPGLLE